MRPLREIASLRFARSVAPIASPLFLTLFLALLATPAPAAYDAFLKIAGIDGESTDQHHKGWIEVDSFQHGLQRAATYGTPGAQRSSLQDISITKQIDKASPLIYKACCSGQRITSATLELRRTYGDIASPYLYMRITLKDVIITSVSPTTTANSALMAAGGERPSEEVSLNFSKIVWNYIERDSKTGQAKGEVTVAWNAADDTPADVVEAGTGLHLR